MRGSIPGVALPGKTAMSKRKLNLPPKVKGPGAGTLLRLRGNPLEHLEKLRAVPAKMVRFRAAGEQIYLAKDPGLIQQVLVTKGRHFNKGRSLERARLVFGNGLVMSEGSFYRRQRRLMQPAFHSRRINSFADTMTRQTDRLMAEWQDGESRDLSAVMMRLTLRIVCETLLGTDVDADTAKVRQAMRTLTRLFPLLMLPLGNVLRHLPFRR
jgi:cytochrome P450